MAVFEARHFGINIVDKSYGHHISHFYVAPGIRGQNYGSAILETIKRVCYDLGDEKLTVSMGGGDAAVAFLEANDFDVTDTRGYKNTTDDYGVNAEFVFDF